MDYFLSNILIALGVSVTPAPQAPMWIPYAITDYFMIEVDLTSIVVRGGPGNWEIFSRVKLTPEAEFQVSGKVKKGAYYVDTITAQCKDDKLKLDEVTVHAKDGTVLQYQRGLGELKNTHVDGSFVTEYLKSMCNSPPQKKPGLMV